MIAYFIDVCNIFNHLYRDDDYLTVKMVPLRREAALCVDRDVHRNIHTTSRDKEFLHACNFPIVYAELLVLKPKSFLVDGPIVCLGAQKI